MRSEPRRWRFGAAEFDEAALILRVNGQAVELERKSLEVLRHLLAHAGQLVTKDQLLAAIWPGRFLSESVLAKRIHKLREALGDEAQTQIVTVHGYGYRLDVPVEQCVPSPLRGEGQDGGVLRGPAPPPLPLKGEGDKTYRWLVASAISVAALAVLLWFVVRPAAPVTDKSVAVLPFVNLSSEKDSEYFTDGLHDTVIGHLSRVGALSVISRTSVMRYRGQHGDLRKIARELGVAHIVEGTVQRAGGRLRVAAQLIETGSDTHLWSQEYDRELADVFAVQADIAQQVAASVQAKLTAAEQAQIERAPTTSAEAYDLYLRALQVNRSFGVERAATEQMIVWLNEAVRLDPQFALGFQLLSIGHDALYWFGIDPSDERRELARRNAEIALRLDPHLPEAHLAYAQYLYHGLRDYTGALGALEKARELAPNHSYVYFQIGTIHRRQGRWDEAVTQMERAVALDPFNAGHLGELGLTMELLRRYDEAERYYARVELMGAQSLEFAFYRAMLAFARSGDLEPAEKALAAVPPGMDPGCGPTFGRWQLATAKRQFVEAARIVLGCREGYITSEAGERDPTEFFAALSYASAGEDKLAREHAELARRYYARELAQNSDRPQTRMNQAFMLALLGEREQAEAECEAALKMTTPSRDAIVWANLHSAAARLYAMTGDKERALRELEISLTLPAGLGANVLKRDPAFDALRDDPRFQQLLTKHLPRSA